jgi:hypothetical protein
MSETPPAAARWAPWWATVLAVAALIPPGAVLAAGLQQVQLAMSDRYMHELAALVAPILIALGVMLLVPGVLYLILRRRFLLVVAVLVAAAIVLAALV